MKQVILICFLLLFGSGVKGETIVLGMSQDQVAITATFDGSNILVFGAIKREGKIPKVPLHIIVSISGPSTPIVVRRKANTFGIWANKYKVTLDSAPSYYAVATSAPWDQVISEQEDLQHKISINSAISYASTQNDILNADNFRDALIRIRTSQGLYQILEGDVAIDEQTLFRTSINMPANLLEGNYRTRIFLTRDKKVINHFETSIDVKKVGLERLLYRLSRENGLGYGLLSLAIAIFSGWLASSVFQYIRIR